MKKKIVFRCKVLISFEIEILKTLRKKCDGKKSVRNWLLTEIKYV